MEVHKGSAESVMSIRISGIVSCEMSKMFALIMDVDSRKKWDMAIAGTEVREKLDDHNEIMYAQASFTHHRLPQPLTLFACSWSAYPSMAGGGTVTDYSLLRTWRKDEDRYIVASRSVAHPAVPVSDEKKYVRGEVNPSGFILTPWIMDDGMGEWRDDEKAAQVRARGKRGPRGARPRGVFASSATSSGLRPVNAPLARDPRAILWLAPCGRSSRSRPANADLARAPRTLLWLALHERSSSVPLARAQRTLISLAPTRTPFARAPLTHLSRSRRRPSTTSASWTRRLRRCWAGPGGRRTACSSRSWWAPSRRCAPSSPPNLEITLFAMTLIPGRTRPRPAPSPRLDDSILPCKITFLQPVALS